MYRSSKWPVLRGQDTWGLNLLRQLRMECVCSCFELLNNQCGGFLKWWYPTTMGFPTKTDHFGVFFGYHHLRKHPCVC